MIVPDGRQPRKRPVTNVDRFGHLKNEARLKFLDMAKMLYEPGKVSELGAPWQIEQQLPQLTEAVDHEPRLGDAGPVLRLSDHLKPNLFLLWLAGLCILHCQCILLLVFDYCNKPFPCVPFMRRLSVFHRPPQANVMPMQVLAPPDQECPTLGMMLPPVHDAEGVVPVLKDILVQLVAGSMVTPVTRSGHGRCQYCLDTGINMVPTITKLMPVITVIPVSTDRIHVALYQDDWCLVGQGWCMTSCPIT